MFGYCPYLYSCKMKMMKKYCALLLLLVSVLSLSSCSNRIERLQRQVRLEGIESVHLLNHQTLQMDLRVLNDSPHKLAPFPHSIKVVFLRRSIDGDTNTQVCFIFLNKLLYLIFVIVDTICRETEAI